MWQAEEDLASGTNILIPPEMVVLTPSQDLLLVYVDDVTQQILYRRWDGTRWELPTPIQNAFTADRPALDVLPGAGAVLAYRGLDNKVYTTRYDGVSWSISTGIATPNVRTDSPPVVAHGIGDAEVELVYTTASGTQSTAYHTRFIDGAWSAPNAIFIARGTATLALASAP